MDIIIIYFTEISNVAEYTNFVQLLHCIMLHISKPFVSYGSKNVDRFEKLTSI